MSDELEPSTPLKRSPLRLIVVFAPLLVFGALVAVFFTQLMSGKDTSELPSALIGKQVPQFELPALPGLKTAGQQVPGLKSEDFKDKVTLINIFASWCAPCRAEHPVLMSLSKNPDLTIFGINYKDVDENALRFLGALGNPYDRVGTDQKGRTAIDWGFYGVPETLLVGPDGVIRFKIVGPISAQKFDELKIEIDKLMKEQTANS
jgi:cytochrome c biogenesis protein CcmG/thiol:disulfide interchange protein DsbE